MVTIQSVSLQDCIFTGIQLDLPNSQLLIVMGETGYIISASFSIQLNELWHHEGFIAGSVRRVASIDELLQAPLEQITDRASQYGWSIGMTSETALLKIS